MNGKRPRVVCSVRPARKHEARQPNRLLFSRRQPLLSAGFTDEWSAVEVVEYPCEYPVADPREGCSLIPLGHYSFLKHLRWVWSIPLDGLAMRCECVDLVVRAGCGFEVQYKLSTPAGCISHTVDACAPHCRDACTRNSAQFSSGTDIWLTRVSGD